MLDQWEQIGFVVLTFFLMFGIGSSLNKKQFLKIIKNPKPLLIGVFSQLIWMPLLAYGIKTGSNLSTYSAIGFLLIGLTPGGALSNIFSYYAKANLALSMSMTITTTVMSFISFPFWLYIFLKPYSSIEIPYLQIIGSLALMLIPVILGMLVRVHYPHKALRIEKLSSYSGVVLIIYLVISGLVKNGYQLKIISINIYLAVFLLQGGGFLFGWLFAKFLKLELIDQKAIGLETGIQNAPLSFSIILLSFPTDIQSDILLVPLLYALQTVIFGSVYALIFRNLKN
jgi:BASS family bile acid:Na+ symporter